MSSLREGGGHSDDTAFESFWFPRSAAICDSISTGSDYSAKGFQEEEGGAFFSFRVANRDNEVGIFFGVRIFCSWWVGTHSSGWFIFLLLYFCKWSPCRSVSNACKAIFVCTAFCESLPEVSRLKTYTRSSFLPIHTVLTTLVMVLSLRLVQHMVRGTCFGASLRTPPFVLLPG